ncbi:MAG TPA: TetR/AcrR family transcriptional regulator [Spirochaetota bacterium]|nr:TetR/AcrR family transcriptional regulator [Spirochaetota bacterium]HPJ33639.1 TetR/AcrR family transcriptional regulator [Spirochaetota bacterium]
MRKGTETKERIIEKALTLFHEKGYNLTSMNDIVEETGVKKGNLYFHYKSKEELAIRVLKEALRGYDRFISSNMKGATPLMKLISMIQGIVAFHVERGNGRGCIFGNMALESKGENPALAEYIKSVFTSWEKNISELIGSSIELGEISGIDSPERYARIILAQLEGAVMLSKVYSEFEPLRESAEIIIEGLKSKMRRVDVC